METSPDLDAPPSIAAEASGSDVARSASDDATESLSSDQKSITSSLSSAYKLRPKGSFTSYHKPLRFDTSASSLSAPSLSQREPAVRSTTPSDTGSDTSFAGIGMALGSPTNPTHHTIAPWPAFTSTVTTTVEALSPRGDGSSKSKSRKWGIFSRSRLKKGSSSDSRLMDDPTGIRSASPVQYPRSQRGADARDVRELSPRQRHLSKSRTEPSLGRSNSSIPKTVLTRRGTVSAGTADGADRTSARRAETTDTTLHSPASSSSDHLLDISIPDVTMERYSIMFGHLIEDRSAASLLSRRLAARDKLKAIQEDEALAQLSASTTSVPRVPVSGTDGSSAQLLPYESEPGPRLSPRQRSSTFPTMPSTTSGSSIATTWESQPQLDPPLHVVAYSRRGNNGDKLSARGSLPANRPLLISKFHQRSSSEQGPAPTPSLLAADDRMRLSAKPLSPRSKISPQTWNTAHPPRSAPPPPAGRALPTSPARPSTSRSNEEDPAPGQDPVEMSIARQIIVSRQQQALLRPLQKQGASDKRVEEIDISTPRMVDSWQDPKMSPALHRMSETIILEGG